MLAISPSGRDKILLMSKKFYVTTSIPYANAEPHVGFAMEIIQADTLARYHRQRGYDVHFLTGSDEHGVKQFNSAKALGISTQELSDRNSDKFRALREPLNLSWDDFIRTTDQVRHWPACQKLWRKLVAAGKLEKRKYKGLYCPGCEEFKLEKDLLDGKCPNHPASLQVVEEENWFFRLSDYSDQILKILESKQVEIVPEFRAKEILNVIKEGLHDVSFSRPKASLPWGVPVPGDDTQTMYVWCDALTNYISAIGYAVASDQFPVSSEEKNSTLNPPSSTFQIWWPADTHVIGKDIVRFHAAIWLGMLLAAEIKLPKRIYVHGFITSEGKKMSKSTGNVVSPIEVVNEWGADALRYYLLSEIPSGQDGDFSKARFEEIYNAHLANGLGNLVSRVVAMASKQGSEFRVPSFEDSIKFATRNSQLETHGKEQAEKMWQGINTAMQEYDFRRALLSVGELVEWANKYITETKPWELKNDLEKQTIILRTLLEVIRHLALALYPFISTTAEKIAGSLGVELTGDFEKLKEWGGVREFKLTKPEILFPKKI